MIRFETLKAHRSNGIGTVFIREIERMGSRPLYALGTVILPVLSFLLLWTIFHEGIPRELPIAICDADHSALSRKIQRALDASSTIRVAFEVNDPESGHRLIRQGKAYALIVLRKDLERDTLAGKAPFVVHYFNNELLLPGNLINRDVNSTIKAISNSISLTPAAGKGGSLGTDIHIEEPVIVEHRQLFNPYLNYSYFLVSALLPTMLQLFALIMTVFAVGIEFKESTAKEWLTASGSCPWKALMGKLLPYTVIFIVVGIFMNIFLFGFLGTPLRGSLPALIFAAISLVLIYQAIGLVIISVTANLRLSLNVAAFFSTTAFAFVGIVFPEAGMSQVAKSWSAILPLTHYLKIFVNQAMRGAPVAGDIISSCILLAVTACLLVYPLLRIRVLMEEDRYWGLA